MQSDYDAFKNSIMTMDEETLRPLCLRLYSENCLFRMNQKASEGINTQMTIQYNELSEKCRVLEQENANLKALLEKETEKKRLHAKSTFGRKTESALALLEKNADVAKEFDDESQTEDVPAGETELEAKSGRAASSRSGPDRKGNSPAGKGGGHKKTNRLEKSIENLPREVIFDADVRKLDEQYGKGNWRISFWHSHSTLEKLDTPYYKRVVLTPVVSVGLEHHLETIPYENLLIDRSLVSASLLSEMYYRKIALSLPCYRQAKDYQMQGIDISKQTIINWMAAGVPIVFEPVAEYLAECLIRYKYTQSDETYIQVNKDGCAAGHKSFLWVHASSELADCNPIVVFCYEATRNTDHLRDFYRDFVGYITSDAYISYKILEDESGGLITVTGCLMHCRRYFAEAFFLIDTTGMDEKTLLELPVVKILLLIRDIYREENKLRDMSAEKRQKARGQFIRPIWEKLFAYIHFLYESDEIFSERMRKAINYAINQEEHLSKFLYDGNIPCDNGNSERKIRAYSIGRANWLFADTISGAEQCATMYTIVETAKANGVNVLLYLRYLLEEMPKHRGDTDRSYLDGMVPWSGEYKEYEKKHLESLSERFRRMFPEPVKPRTPRKKDPPPESSDSRTA